MDLTLTLALTLVYDRAMSRNQSGYTADHLTSSEIRNAKKQRKVSTIEYDAVMKPSNPDP